MNYIRNIFNIINTKRNITDLAIDLDSNPKKNITGNPNEDDPIYQKYKDRPFDEIIQIIENDNDEDDPFNIKYNDLIAHLNSLEETEHHQNYKKTKFYLRFTSKMQNNMEADENKKNEFMNKIQKYLDQDSIDCLNYKETGDMLNDFKYDYNMYKNFDYICAQEPSEGFKYLESLKNIFINFKLVNQHIVDVDLPEDTSNIYSENYLHDNREFYRNINKNFSIKNIDTYLEFSKKRLNIHIEERKFNNKKYECQKDLQEAISSKLNSFQGYLDNIKNLINSDGSINNYETINQWIDMYQKSKNEYNEKDKNEEISQIIKKVFKNDNIDSNIKTELIEDLKTEYNSIDEKLAKLDELCTKIKEQQENEKKAKVEEKEKLQNQINNSSYTKFRNSLIEIKKNDSNFSIKKLLYNLNDLYIITALINNFISLSITENEILNNIIKIFKDTNKDEEKLKKIKLFKNNDLDASNIIEFINEFTNMNLTYYKNIGKKIYQNYNNKDYDFIKYFNDDKIDKLSNENITLPAQQIKIDKKASTESNIINIKNFITSSVICGMTCKKIATDLLEAIRPLWL